MFIAALFAVSATWKQCMCPSTEEWIKKMWYIDTREYYSAIKRNETGSFVELWLDPESAIQSEGSQKEETECNILKHIYGIQKNGAGEPICRAGIEMQTESESMHTAGEGWGELREPH